MTALFSRHTLSGFCIVTDGTGRFRSGPRPSRTRLGATMPRLAERLEGALLGAPDASAADHPAISHAAASTARVDVAVEDELALLAQPGSPPDQAGSIWTTGAAKTLPVLLGRPADVRALPGRDEGPSNPGCSCSRSTTICRLSGVEAVTLVEAENRDG